MLATEPNKNNKWIIIVLSLAVLAALVFILFANLRKDTALVVSPPKNQIDSHRTIQERVERQDLTPAQVPTDFPKGLPLGSGAVTKNYVQTLSNGTKESVREYEVTGELVTINAQFLSFFEKDGWKITAQVVQKENGFYMLAGAKGTKTLVVNMNENSITKVKKVELTLSDVAQTTAGTK